MPPDPVVQAVRQALPETVRAAEPEGPSTPHAATAAVDCPAELITGAGAHASLDAASGNNGQGFETDYTVQKLGEETSLEAHDSTSASVMNSSGPDKILVREAPSLGQFQGSPPGPQPIANFLPSPTSATLRNTSPDATSAERAMASIYELKTSPQGREPPSRAASLPEVHKSSSATSLFAPAHTSLQMLVQQEVTNEQEQQIEGEAGLMDPEHALDHVQDGSLAQLHIQDSLMAEHANGSTSDERVKISETTENMLGSPLADISIDHASPPRSQSGDGSTTFPKFSAPFVQAIARLGENGCKVEHVLHRNALLADIPGDRSEQLPKQFGRNVMRKEKRRRKLLLGHIQAQTAKLRAKAAVLRSEYKRLDALWKADCERLDQATTLKPPQVLFNGFAPTALPTPVAAPVTPYVDESAPARANRRRDPAGYLGDTARTEAEFEEILAALGDADMRDPNLRAAKTTAVVPDMQLTHQADTQDDENGLVLDPVAFYGTQSSHEARWSDPEREAFLKGYLLWPKQFGKMTSRLIPDKTPSEAVLYYYRTKKGFNYKEALSLRGGSRKRRPGSGRRGGKTSLLAGMTQRQPSIITAEDGPARPADQGMSASGGGKNREASPPDSDGVPDAVESEARDDDSSSLASRGNISRGRSGKSTDLASVITANSNDATLEDAAVSRKGVVRKRKISTTAADGTPSEKPPRKKAATSSYWSTSEKHQVLQLLSTPDPPDFARIASIMENKSAQQVRNYYFNHHADVLASKASSGLMSADGESQRPPPSFSGVMNEEPPSALPRTGLFQPMPNALHSLVSDPSLASANNGLADSSRARGLNIAALLNDDNGETADGEARKRELMGEWFGRDPSGSGTPDQGPRTFDEAASDATEDDAIDVHAVI